MPANRFLPHEWESRLEEIDLEIVRQAAICKVALLDPGAIERVLANDAGVCGTEHEAGSGRCAACCICTTPRCCISARD